jgi:DNA-binding phage protein
MEQFETLASRLFQSASPQARAKAAAILGRSELLSQTLEQLVIENIGEDLVSFLANAEELSDRTLLDVLARYDVAAAATIASRKNLTNVVLAKLFQMNSRKVYRALSQNMDITPRGAYLSALARSAQMDHLVAEALGERRDFDAALLAPAFFDLSDSHRIKVIQAFANRETPAAPISRTIEQLSVATPELTKALMKLFSENRRPEVTKLLAQITGLDEVRCGQIAHDVTGASTFVVLRGFGVSAYDGLKVLIHATSHDSERSRALADFASLFATVSADAMAYLMSAWRGEVNLLDLSKPQYRPVNMPSRRTPAAASSATSTGSGNPVVEQAMVALSRIGARRAG